MISRFPGHYHLTRDIIIIRKAGSWVTRGIASVFRDIFVQFDTYNKFLTEHTEVTKNILFEVNTGNV
jgi:hypothetical protein